MKPKFTGHDTFPLRYGWLHKAVNHLNNNKKLLASTEDNSRETIVDLGVGKNMVNAIRYWGDCTGVIDIEAQYVTDNGSYLFGTKDENTGKDPYLEHVASIWLLHFWLNFNYESLTAYRYFFNYSNPQHFEKSQLVDNLIKDELKLLNQNDKKGSKKPSGVIEEEQRKKAETHKKTVKKDIDCFLNTYCHKVKKSKVSNINEDFFSSPLSELNLVQDSGGGYYTSTLGERADLPVEIFIYALIRFAEIKTLEAKNQNIGFDDLLMNPCSPGRIFRLSETGLDNKLHQAQAHTKSAIAWNNTQGLRQITIKEKIKKNPTKFLDELYGER